MSRHPLDPRDEGKPDAELVIEVEHSGLQVQRPWIAHHPEWEPEMPGKPIAEATAAEALRAARCAVLGIEVIEWSIVCGRPLGWLYRYEHDGPLFGNPDAAICAAIDAREEKP